VSRCQARGDEDIWKLTLCLVATIADLEAKVDEYKSKVAAEAEEKKS
jgi:hypothetical protein